MEKKFTTLKTILISFPEHLPILNLLMCLFCSLGSHLEDGPGREM